MIRSVYARTPKVRSANWYTLSRKITYEYLKPDGRRETQSREAYDRGSSAHHFIVQ